MRAALINRGCTLFLTFCDTLLPRRQDYIMNKEMLEFVRAYAQAQSLAVEENGGSTVSLIVEGLPVHIGWSEDTRIVFIQTGVGILPEDERKVSQFLMHLLCANNLFSETKGFTLGFESETELITLQALCEFDHLTQETFTSLISRFIEQTLHWIKEIDSWDAAADEPESALLPSGNDNIRI